MERFGLLIIYIKIIKSIPQIANIFNQENSFHILIMADSTIYTELSEFGKNIKPIYTLLILSAIIIFFFGIVALFINIVVLIILLTSQKRIKKIASNLKSKTLSSYRIKFLIGFSIGFIGRLDLS